MKLMLNTKWAARSAKRVSSVWCLLCIAGPDGAPPLQAQDVTGSSGWQFAATIYAWLPDNRGQYRAPIRWRQHHQCRREHYPRSSEDDRPGLLRDSEGRWGAITDIVYLDVGDSDSRTQNVSIGGVTLPATVTADTDFDLKSTIWSLAASYRVVASGEAAFDLLAGARLAHLEQNLKWTFTGDFGDQRSRRHHSRAVPTHLSISGTRSSGARGESRLVPITGGRCLTTLTSAPATPISPGRRCSA